MNRILLLFSFIFACTYASVGQSVSTFEDVINLEQDTFWNGSDLSGGFVSGDAFFPTEYNTQFDFWSGGWALSNVKDSVTSGFGNLYAAKTAGGFESDTYAVGQQGSIIKLQEPVIGQSIDGIYITNSTYAYNSMRDGDDFAKAFGGPTGDDPDFFKLTIRKYADGVLSSDSVDFFLADYRFDDNSQDYIVDTWEFVDLSGLGNVDSLYFELASTDTFGVFLNTPAFFCIDQLIPSNANSQNDLEFQTLKVFPNPAVDFVQISGDEKAGAFAIFNAQGQLMLQRANASGDQQVDITAWPNGSYFIQWKKDRDLYQARFVK